MRSILCMTFNNLDHLKSWQNFVYRSVRSAKQSIISIAGESMTSIKQLSRSTTSLREIYIICIYDKTGQFNNYSHC
jgi:hypothetical protein